MRRVVATANGAGTVARPEKFEISRLRPAERSEESESQLRIPQSAVQAKQSDLILLMKAFGDWQHLSDN